MQYHSTGQIDVDKLTFQEKVNYWTGSLIVSIGEGKLRTEVQNLIYITQQEAYNRGLKEGRAEKTNWAEFVEKQVIPQLERARAEAFARGDSAASGYLYTSLRARELLADAASKG